MYDLDTRAPDAVELVTGDFNHCNLKTALPRYGQYVTRATRSDGTLDLFYSNVHNAYRSVPLPPLGCFRHSLEHLRPSYRPVVQRQPLSQKLLAIGRKTLGGSDGMFSLHGLVLLWSPLLMCAN